MKTMQKAIAVLLACFFMTSVFAATAPAATPAQPNGQAAATTDAPAAPAMHKKHHCKKGKNGKCMKMHHHKKKVKQAAPAAQ